MAWNEVFDEVSPALSSPYPYHVLPTLMMPRPCICSALPDVSSQAAPGVKVEVVSARAGSAGSRSAASTAASATRRRKGREQDGDGRGARKVSVH